MVRLSEIMQVAAKKPITQPSAAPVAPAAEEKQRAPSVVSEAVSPFVKALDSQALYQGLLEACQHSFECARHEQRCSLGQLPSLAERLVQRLIQDGQDLLRLSTMGESSFSLTRHGINVAILAVRVGMELDLKKPQLIDLAVASMLHDIGMVTITPLLQSPTYFNPTQRLQVHEHPTLGHRLLEACADLDPAVCDIVAQEHERFDGSGYPNRLFGRRIDEHAQLVGLLDCYEALTHDRPHRTRLVPAEAMRTIVGHYRTAFRHDLLRAVLDAVPIYPVDSWVRLSSGESAKVIALRKDAVLSPTITILIDREGQPVARPETIDLSREPRLTIDRAIPPPNLTA